MEVPKEVIVKIRKRIEDLAVVKDKSLKWCPTPDCNTAVKKPCCCKKRAICAKCGNDMCFRCNSKWHAG